MITMHSILLAALGVAAAPQFEVQPLRGPPVTGRLVALDGKQVTLEAAARPRRRWRPAELMGISAKPKPAAAAPEPEAWIDLVDGSTLLARQFTVHNGRARDRAPRRRGHRVARRTRVAAVRFQPAAAAAGQRMGAAAEDEDHRRPAGGRARATSSIITKGRPRRDRQDGRVRVGRRGGAGQADQGLRPDLPRRPSRSRPSRSCWIVDAGGSRWAVALA